MKTLLITLLLTLTLTANEYLNKNEEMLSYSDLFLNESFSFYAGKFDMDFFENTDAYSVGILMQDEVEPDMEFGVGYMQPCSKLDNMFSKSAPTLYSQNGEGILFFMNYSY